MRSYTQADYLPVSEYMTMLQAMSVKHTGKPPNWREEVPKAGYHHVALNANDHWRDAHDWCTEVCGKEHYSWSGSNFFFTRKSDALMFALQFG